jgi:apolipoprotein N-acyltransferase
MVFWIAILAGGLFAWLAVRIGFYTTWVLLFNVLISIYVAIFLAPAVTGFAPASGRAASYGTALSMIVLAGGCFAILHGLSYVFLTGQFNIPFPRIFDILLSGLLGFMAGFLILSFAAVVLTTTPLAQQKIVSSIGFNRQSQRANILCLAGCCDLIHAVAGSDGGKGATEAAIDRLMDASISLELKRNEQKPDANEPPTAPKTPPRQAGARRKIIDDSSADTP